MKNRFIIPTHKKKAIHAMMLFTLLAPTFLSASFVFAEDTPSKTEQTNLSEPQESTETTESSSESSVSLDSSIPEETIISTTSEENETTISTAEARTTEESNNPLIAPAADTITIADPILKQALITTLGLPAGSELTQADMDRLTNLSLNSAQLSSLSGLENAKNLSTIYINTNNNVTDFSPLEQLSLLTFVTLQTKSLTSANFPDLSKNTGITNLGLGSTSIDNDVMPKIAQLTSLRRIYMDSNVNVTTIAPLKSLPNLTSLSAQFCGITDFTVINEFPVLNDLAAFGQNTGRTDAPTTIGRSSLDYDFDKQTLFLPFAMMPNRMTNFDGYVPPFTTSNSASNTYFDFNGIQLPASRLQITEQGITVLGVTEDEFKNLYSFKYNARLNNPAGTYEQPAGFTFYAISGGTYLHQFNVLDDGQPVTVRYQDTDGKELLPSETRSGLVGQTFDIAAPSIPDYVLTELPSNASGSFSDQEQTVTFVYKKDAAPIIETEGKVTARYIDTAGNTLRQPIVQSDTIGKTFTTEQLTFTGFTFKEVKGNTTGLFTEEEQVVTYIYSKDEDRTDPTSSTDSSETATSSSETGTGTANGTNESTTQSTNSSNDSQVSKAATNARSAAKKKFPATGEQSSYTWIFFGLVLIGYVNYRYILKKVRQEK